MTQYAIFTDLNRCVGCLACSVACKTVNDVPVGKFWNKTLRIGPIPKEGGSGQFPDVEMYFLTLQCQHCENPECVSVCPTAASHKLEDGTVQVDKEKCIGCQFCTMACPYGVRYLNEEHGVVEKCSLCDQKISQGELPQCVSQCGGRARYFGDIHKGYDSFEGPAPLDVSLDEQFKKVHAIDYQATINSRDKMLNVIKPFDESQIHHLTNVGNNPSFLYILRDTKWQGEDN